MRDAKISQDTIGHPEKAAYWLTLEEAADHLRVSKQTLYRWVQEGRLIAYELPSGRGRRLRREDLDDLLTPSGQRYVLVSRGIAQASGLGHEMERVIESETGAFFRCRRCGETFTISPPETGGRRGADAPLQLLAASVLKFPCSGRPPNSSKYVGEVAVIPPDDPSSQPVIQILEELGVAAWSLRARPDPDNPYSLRFPIEAWARSYAEAQERLVGRVRGAVTNALSRSHLKPDTVRIELVPDSVHGPTLG